MNEYSHITQSLVISSLTSVYFAWKWFLKQSHKQEKNDTDRELLQNIEIIRFVSFLSPNDQPSSHSETTRIQKLLI